MKTTADRLSQALDQPLAPVYFITGDEPLQLMESAEAIRERARTEGVADRTVLFPARGFDWSELTIGGSNLSLFAERRLIELRFAAKPDKEATAALSGYLDNPPEHNVLLITAPHLGSSTARWIKKIDAVGVIVQVWPIDRDRLPRWLAARMRRVGLQPDHDALELLAERIEGNLLAATQEIEKLRLLHGEGAVDVEAVSGSVADSARYDVFKLTEAALEGDVGRAAHVLDGLRAEGVEAMAVLATLAWQIRSIASIAFRVRQGESLDAAMRAARVWPRRQTAVRQALARHDLGSLWAMLDKARYADLTIKGRRPGRAWPVLLELVTALAGERTVKRRVA